MKECVFVNSYTPTDYFFGDFAHWVPEPNLEKYSLAQLSRRYEPYNSCHKLLRHYM